MKPFSLPLNKLSEKQRHNQTPVTDEDDGSMNYDDSMGSFDDDEDSYEEVPMTARGGKPSSEHQKSHAATVPRNSTSSSSKRRRSPSAMDSPGKQKPQPPRRKAWETARGENSPHLGATSQHQQPQDSSPPESENTNLEASSNVPSIRLPTSSTISQQTPRKHHHQDNSARSSNSNSADQYTSQSEDGEEVDSLTSPQQSSNKKPPVAIPNLQLGSLQNSVETEKRNNTQKGRKRRSRKHGEHDAENHPRSSSPREAKPRHSTESSSSSSKHASSQQQHRRKRHANPSAIPIDYIIRNVASATPSSLDDVLIDSMEEVQEKMAQVWFHSPEHVDNASHLFNVTTYTGNDEEPRIAVYGTHQSTQISLNDVLRLAKERDIYRRRAEQSESALEILQQEKDSLKNELGTKQGVESSLKSEVELLRQKLKHYEKLRNDMLGTVESLKQQHAMLIQAIVTSQSTSQSEGNGTSAGGANTTRTTPGERRGASAAATANGNVQSTSATGSKSAR